MTNQIPETSIIGVIHVTLSHKLPQAEASDLLETVLARMADSVGLYIKQLNAEDIKWRASASHQKIIVETPFAVSTGQVE